MWYLMFVLGVYVSIYTFSYGMWEWKKSNKSGAIAIFAFCLIAIALPAVKIFL